jgi:CDGSH-type Zn-finger protein
MNPIAIDLEAGQTYFWCRCGRSATQPFCDGAHQGTLSSPLKFTAAETGRRWLCACKKTASPPFCDGSHNAGPAAADS